MPNISATERETLFKRIYHQLGAPIRTVEVTDEMMDTYLEIALEDYSQILNDWMIEQQWGSLAGLNIQSADFTFGFATKSLDYVRSFSYAYSKQVGMGNGSPWELKKDFITIVPNQQFYTIPANREVNEVMWYTPSPVGSGVDPLNPNIWMANQFGWSVGGITAGYMQPMFSTLLAAQDRNLKNKVMRSDMSYRITGNADGTKTLHLYPVPDGRYESFNFGLPSEMNGNQVWYWYYDVNANNVDKCLTENPDITVVTSMNDVPISNIPWSRLNDSSRTWIRQYLLALTKAGLGKVRGKYSGQLDVTNASVTLDYADLIAEGKEEKEKLETTLKEKLEGLSNSSQLEKKAMEAENLNKILGYIPLKIYMK